jgi:hypothetical protein
MPNPTGVYLYKDERPPKSNTQLVSIAMYKFLGDLFKESV